MQDLSSQVIATIFVGMSSVSAALWIAFFITRKKKHLEIEIFKTENASSDLQRKFSFLTDEFGVIYPDKIHRSIVRLTCLGNTSIQNVKLRLSIPGNRKILIANSANSRTFAPENCSVSSKNDILLGVSSADLYIPFLNPKENFLFDVFFDGEQEKPTVTCRLEDVSIKIRNKNNLETDAKQAKSNDFALGFSAAIMTFASFWVAGYLFIGKPKYTYTPSLMEKLDRVDAQNRAINDALKALKER